MWRPIDIARWGLGGGMWHHVHGPGVVGRGEGLLQPIGEGCGGRWRIGLGEGLSYIVL
jgi:hypothetical protein